jgi:hypothetical protein
MGTQGISRHQYRGLRVLVLAGTGPPRIGLFNFPITSADRSHHLISLVEGPAVLEGEHAVTAAAASFIQIIYTKVWVRS